MAFSFNKLLDEKNGLDLPDHNYFHFQVGLFRPVLKYRLSY